MQIKTYNKYKLSKPLSNNHKVMQKPHKNINKNKKSQKLQKNKSKLFKNKNLSEQQQEQKQSISQAQAYQKSDQSSSSEIQEQQQQQSSFSIQESLSMQNQQQQKQQVCRKKKLDISSNYQLSQVCKEKNDMSANDNIKQNENQKAKTTTKIKINGKPNILPSQPNQYQSFFQKQAEKYELNQNKPSNIDIKSHSYSHPQSHPHSYPHSHSHSHSQQKYQYHFQQKQKQGNIKRKRGRRPKGSQLQPSPTSLYFSDLKKRKIQNISNYETTLQKLRTQSTTFYWPFQKFPLNLHLEKQKLLTVTIPYYSLQNLKNAKDLKIKVRQTVRAVGVRHERNLFKYGVQEQLKFIIEYLQNGKIPRWMKQHFQELLEKDFSRVTELQMHPTLI